MLGFQRPLFTGPHDFECRAQSARPSHYGALDTRRVRTRRLPVWLEVSPLLVATTRTTWPLSPGVDKLPTACKKQLSGPVRSGLEWRKSPTHFECPEHYARRAAKRVTIARTVQLLNAIHDAKHAAAETTETLAASHALSTSAQNAKARWIQRGTIRTTAPRYKAQFVNSAKKLVMTKSDAQRDRVLHVVIGRTSLRRTLNVQNTYAQHAAKKVTITRIAQPVNKSISATGHSGREVHPKLSAYAPRAATQRISNTVP
jgi:hypothetical protein